MEAPDGQRRRHETVRSDQPKARVYIGAWHDEKSGSPGIPETRSPEHILAFAPTRSGKGVGLVIPSLLGWEGSAVIFDIKGENWDRTAGYRVAQPCLLPLRASRRA